MIHISDFDMTHKLHNDDDDEDGDDDVDDDNDGDANNNAGRDDGDTADACTTASVTDWISIAKDSNRWESMEQAYGRGCAL